MVGDKGVAEQGGIQGWEFGALLLGAVYQGQVEGQSRTGGRAGCVGVSVVHLSGVSVMQRGPEVDLAK